MAITWYRSTTISCLGQSLYHAIYGGRHQIVEMLLTAGADVCGPSETCLTPLSTTVKLRDKNLVRRLLRAGAAVNSIYYNTSKGGYVRASVLPAVVRWGDHSLILEIIKAGADVNATKGTRPRTALVIAADKGDVTSVNILINAGADTNHYDVRNSTLTAAILKNSAFIAQNLLTFGADPDELAIMAAISASQELLRMVLKARLSHYKRFSQGYGCCD
jgi:ankyrin repeat protein